MRGFGGLVARRKNFTMPCQAGTPVPPNSRLDPVVTFDFTSQWPAHSPYWPLINEEILEVCRYMLFRSLTIRKSKVSTKLVKLMQPNSLHTNVLSVPGLREMLRSM